MKAVNDAAADNDLSANLMEGVLSSVLASIRAQAIAELIVDMGSSVQEPNQKKEGEKK